MLIASRLRQWTKFSARRHRQCDRTTREGQVQRTGDEQRLVHGDSGRRCAAVDCCRVRVWGTIGRALMFQAHRHATPDQTDVRKCTVGCRPHHRCSKVVLAYAAAPSGRFSGLVHLQATASAVDGSGLESRNHDHFVQPVFNGLCGSQPWPWNQRMPGRPKAADRRSPLNRAAREGARRAEVCSSNLARPSSWIGVQAGRPHHRKQKGVQAGRPHHRKQKGVQAGRPHHRIQSGRDACSTESGDTILASVPDRHPSRVLRRPRDCHARGARADARAHLARPRRGRGRASR